MQDPSIDLDRGANGSQAKRDGWTPLLIASKGGHDECVTLLLERGMSVNRAKVDGWTPIMVASQNGHASTVELLLSRGAH